MASVNPGQQEAKSHVLEGAGNQELALPAAREGAAGQCAGRGTVTFV